MADSSQSIIDQLNTSMLGPQSGSTGTQATAADFLPGLQQSDQQALGNLSTSNTGGSYNSGGSLINNIWNGMTTGWNSIEDNPITRNVVDPVMNSAAGVTNMFSAMAPDPNKPLSWDSFNPLSPIKSGIDAFWQGYNNPENTPLGKEDSAWRGLLGNSLDPRGPLQDPIQSIQQGWNNPSSAPSYRSIANDFFTGGKDVPYLSDVLGVGTGLLSNPINHVAMKAPFSAAEDAGFYRQDLQGHYTPPETVGSMPQMPLSDQPFNVVSKPPQMNTDYGSMSRIWDQMPTSDIQATKPDTPYQTEFNQALQDEFNRLKDIRNNPPGMIDKGGLIKDDAGYVQDSYKPTSGNPQWYRDSYAQNGRKPTNDELMQIAHDNLMNGEKDSFFGDTPAWKPQAAQDLEHQMNQVSEMIQTEKDPTTLESLGKTLDALQQEHDSIVGQAKQQVQQGYKPTVNVQPSGVNDILDSIFGKEAPARSTNMNSMPNILGKVQTSEMRAKPNEIPNEAAATTETPNTVADSMPKSNPSPYYDKTLGLPWEKYANAAMSPVKNVASKIGDLPGVSAVKDTLGNKFVKNYGASPELSQILKTRQAEHATNQWKILQSIKQMADHGLNKDEYNDIGHIVEKTKEGNDKQNAFVSKFENLRDNGVSDSTGTNSLVNTTLNGNPLIDNVLPDYFKHMYRNIPKELKGVFPKSGSRPSGLSPKGEFNLPRTYGTLKESVDAGLKPVTDPLLVQGEHLSQTSKAVTNARALNDIIRTPGLLFDKNIVDEVSKLVKTGRMTADEAAQRLGMSVEDLKKGFVPSSIPQLNKYYIRPADETAIRNYLDHVDKNTLFDKGMGYWKKGTVFNSLVHMHNILYNGLWLGGAKIKYAAETFMNLKKRCQ
jgi:hypothetical protein